MTSRDEWAERAADYLEQAVLDNTHELASDLRHHGPSCPRYQQAERLLVLTGRTVGSFLAAYRALHG
jgi:hypothetical protein